MIIDSNVYLSRWPTRRLPCDETPLLVAKLKENQVRSAWVGSFDGLLHNDLSAVNSRLASECEMHGQGLLVPFGTIIPMLPDWQEDLRRCVEEHRMPGIRLHPNYHGYGLNIPVVQELFALCEKYHLVVQLVLRMEDERTQHRLLRVAAVDTKPLAQILKKYPSLQLVVLNGLRTLSADAAAKLIVAGNVWFEISMLEGVGGIENFLKNVPLGQVLFGSYFPFFCFDSAVLKLRESELGGVLVDAIQQGNARRLIDPD